MKDKDNNKKANSSASSKKDDILSTEGKAAARLSKSGQAITEVKASARFLHISPKKVKLVIDLVRGLRVGAALQQLQFVNKKATRFVVKLVNSAIANAENNFHLKKEDLYIKFIVANQGPTIHRFKPAAFGQAHPIRKRSTHLELILGVKGVDSPKKPLKEIKAKAPKAKVEPVKKETKTVNKPKAEPKVKEPAKESLI